MKNVGALLLSLVALPLCVCAAACGDDVETTDPAGAAGSTSGTAGMGGSSAGAGGVAGNGGSVAAGAGGSVAGSGGSAAGAAGAGGASAGSAGAAGSAGLAGAGGAAAVEVLPLSALGHDRLLAVAFDASGSAYAVGAISDTTEATADFATIVVKLDPTGKLDKSFGVEGVARHNLVVGAGGETARGIVVQADGRIVVGATIEHAGGDPRDRDIAVARLLPSGQLDMMFGTGGVAVLDLSPGEALPDGTYTADAQWGLGLLSDGKLVVSGAKKSKTGTDRDHAMVRLDASGKLDTSFGEQGVLSFDLSMQGADARALLVLPDDSVIGSGYSKNASGVVGPVVYKVTKAGKLDTDFGTGGVFHQAVLPHTTEAYAVALQGESLVTLGYGKAAETESLDWLSLRLSKDGKLDTTYGDQGVARVDCAGFNDNGRSVLTLPDGKILLMGSGRSDASSADAMLALLTKDGVADPSFGPSGKRVFDLGGTGDQFWGAALSPDKKRVVIVGTKGSSTTNDDAAVLVLPTP